MKKKNGFTLIELLGVIVILAIILAIVIMNLSKISNDTRDKYNDKQKDEIIEASKEYFTTNNNYLTDLNDGYSVYVSLGALVKEDYLNKMTSTNKNEFNKCDIVLVSKKNGKLSYEYIDEDTAVNSGIITSNNCSLTPVVINSVDIKSTTETSNNTTKKDETTTTSKSEPTPPNSSKPIIDTEKPTCSITLSGTKGNVVNKVQWYKSNVTVKLTYKDNVSVSNYDLSTSNKIPQSFNNIKSLTLSSETNKITYYGYVKDAENNIGTCKISFAVEKNVRMSLNVNKTNLSDATNSKITSKNKNIFKGNSCIKYQNSGGSGNCMRELSNGKYVGCADDNGGNNKFYFGKACEYVGDYERTFSISSISGVSSATYKNDKSNNKNLIHIDTKSWSKSVNENVFRKVYKADKLKDNGNRVNITRHQFQYISPAGNKSNYVIMYTEYSVNCGYPKY